MSSGESSPRMLLPPKYYRTRVLLDLCRVFVFPVLAVVYLQRTYNLHLGLLSIPSYVLAVLLWGTLQNLYYDFTQRRAAKRLGAKPIPRIKGRWPGNIDILLRMLKGFKNSYLQDAYLELFKEYGCTTLNTRIFWVDQIITMDEEHMKFICSTGFNHFWRGQKQKERMESFLGDGIFNRDGAMWKMHRTNARPFFSRERISDFETFDKHANLTLNLLDSITQFERPCDVQDLYARFTLDSASEFLFGKNLDTLSGSLPIPGQSQVGHKGSKTTDEFGSFAQAFEEAQQIITNRARLGHFWPLVEFLKDKSLGPSEAARRYLDPLVQEALAVKAKTRHSGSPHSVEEQTFLEHLTESTDDVGLIRDELLSILLASRDTTACLLTYVTYFMAMHPEVVKRLRTEVLETHGLDGTPTYESLRNLKYMRAVVNETLRIFPPVPLNVRECRPEPCALPPSLQGASKFVPTPKEPLLMPASTPVIFLPFLMQRNPDLWGEDADAFDPERWIDPERITKLTSNPMMFTPFSAGPRICIGQNFAYNEAFFFLVRLLQRFDTFTLAPDVQPEGTLPPEEWKHKSGRQSIERCWPAAALTLYVKGGLWIRFGKAADSKA